MMHVIARILVAVFFVCWVYLVTFVFGGLCALIADAWVRGYDLVAWQF